MAGEIYYDVDYRDRLINCPYCDFKITVMWSTLSRCLRAQCPRCENIYIKVFNPVACIGCGIECNPLKVIMRTGVQG